MKDYGKHNVAGILIDAVDYDAAVERIFRAAHAGEPYGVSALAVHGVMTGVLDKTHKYRLNRLELVVPDGQPVRWALNLLHGLDLSSRVYGPELMLRVCERAAREKVPIYLYGSRPVVLDALAERLVAKMPGLVIAGKRPSLFRTTTAEEKAEIIADIKASGAKILFVGLGCPRQEVWAYEYREALSMPVLAVGAAFDFHAGLLRQAPKQLQDVGLEWLFRLAIEPKRLWRRYLYLNPAYVASIALQKSGLWRPDPQAGIAPREEQNFG